MDDQKTPDWLIETQNKSWEPEILISGITLTFLFLLPKHTFNFFGMLIQDFGVWQAVSRNLYIVSMTMLTGLKIVLIAHLVLRGIWAGHVGLSYVFPQGVNRTRLPKNQRNGPFVKPEEFVIHLERICSLLFSFIFSTIIFIMGWLLFFVPITLLFFTGLSRQTIQYIVLYGVLPCTFLAGIVLPILFSTKLKGSHLSRTLDRSALSQVIAIYATNIGRMRTLLLFVLYFAVVFAISFDDISRFSFRNNRNMKHESHPGVVTLDRDSYESTRDRRYRIQRATLEMPSASTSRLELFVAFYQEDEYSVAVLAEDDSLRKRVGLPASKDVWVHDLHTVVLDNQPLADLQWSFTTHAETGQAGFQTIVPLHDLAAGFHELRIRKQIWSVKKKEVRDLKEWVRIPFAVFPRDPS